MSTEISGSTEVAELAEVVGALLGHRCPQEVVAAAEADGWAEPVWAALAEGGFCWIGVPEAAGGVGGSLAEACAVLEQVGAHAAPVPVAETMLGGWLLASAGLSVPAGPLTVARGGVSFADGRLRGRVPRVPWARHAERIVLLADRHVVTVAPDDVRIEPGLSVAGEPRDTVLLDGVAPRESAPTGVTPDEWDRRGALTRAAMIAGAAGRIRDLTVAYTNERTQFGRPVARFQAVAAHLVVLAEQAEAARMAARTAALDPTPTAVASAAVVAAQAAGRIAAAAHQATGAMGMTREYPLGQYTRRLWAWREEYGNELAWSTRLGRALAGVDDLWATIAGGAA